MGQTKYLLENDLNSKWLKTHAQFLDFPHLVQVRVKVFEKLQNVEKVQNVDKRGKGGKRTIHNLQIHAMHVLHLINVEKVEKVQNGSHAREKTCKYCGRKQNLKAK